MKGRETEERNEASRKRTIRGSGDNFKNTKHVLKLKVSVKNKIHLSTKHNIYIVDYKRCPPMLLWKVGIEESH